MNKKSDNTNGNFVFRQLLPEIYILGHSLPRELTHQQEYDLCFFQVRPASAQMQSFLTIISFTLQVGKWRLRQINKHHSSRE